MAKLAVLLLLLLGLLGSSWAQVDCSSPEAQTYCGPHGTCVPYQITDILCKCNPGYLGPQCNFRAYMATLSGANEVPPNNSTLTGAARLLVMLGESPMMNLVVNTPVIPTLTSAHIHIGAASATGGVVVPLTVSGGLVKELGPTALTLNMTILAQSRYYVNLHTTAKPGGEIRGQLMPADPCSSFYCGQGGFCYVSDPISVPIVPTCACMDGYTGPACTIQEDTCADMTCYNGGSCIRNPSGDLACSCPDGTQGSNCEITGETCAMEFCENGGTCQVFGSGLNAFAQCSCAEGFLGIHCELFEDACYSSPCVNGGTCLLYLPWFNLCLCPEGFSGPFCETQTFMAELSGANVVPPVSTSATGTASVIISPGGGFQTIVFHDVTGTTGAAVQTNEDQTALSLLPSGPGMFYGLRDLVDTPLDGSTLMAGGYWVSVFSSEHPNAEIRGQLMPIPACDCSENGACVTGENGFECLCLSGFDGAKCEIPLTGCDNINCGFGQCLEFAGQQPYCMCPPGLPIIDQFCNFDLCLFTQAQCQNGGSCNSTTGYCDCPEGYYGLSCENYLNVCETLGCVNGGTCTNLPNFDFNCTCPPFAEGQRCENLIGTCENYGCLNGASCNEICYCTDGWYGPRCDLDFCDLQVCQNGATCVVNGDPQCQCADGWTGNICQTSTTQTRCAEETSSNAVWPAANVGQIVHGMCQAGYSGRVFRTCEAGAVFGAVTGQCYSNSATCPMETFNRAMWPQSSSGLVQGTCIPGWKGTPARQCMPGGQWASYLSSFCEPHYCEAVSSASTNWPRTYPGAQAQGTCNPAYIGSPTRTCGPNGQFDAPSSDCVLNTNVCPAEALYAKASWTQTSGGVIATGTCMAGWTGSPVRVCNKDGTWDTLVQNHCTRKSCSSVTEGHATWPQVFAGAFATGTCESGFFGMARRQCVDGTFGAIEGGCYGPCPAQASFAHASWSSTNPSTDGTGVCAAGWTGSPMRSCTAEGTWSPNVRNQCSRIICPATNNGMMSFPQMNAGTQAYGTCLVGTGRVWRACLIDGTVGPVQGSCV